MNIVLEIFESFFLPHEDPKPLESVGLQKAHCRQLSRFALSRPVLQGDAACIALSLPSPPNAKRAPLPGPSSFRWSQRADSRMPPASAATRPAAAARSRARLRAGHRPARFTPRDLIGSNPRLPQMQKGPRCRDPPRFDGANERIRTADLRITSALLYQLSHVGISCG